MDCLKNFIQIEGCDAPAYAPFDDPETDDVETDDPDTEDVETESPEASGLYINKDLPISLEQIDKIADSEQQTFLGVWDEVQKSAIKKFVIRVKAGYKELFGICNLDEDWFCKNRQNLAYPLLYFLGSELMKERMFSTRINRYTTIDKNKATEMKEEFDQQFIIHLKDALELIDDDQNTEGDDIYNLVETLP